MDWKLSEDQYTLEKQIIDFAKKELNDDYVDGFNRKLWEKCANFGLFGICIPEEYGGLGDTYLSAAIAMKALGYGCEDSGFVFAISNHLWVCENLINLFGSEEQKKKYLPAMIDGSKIGAFALTEADSGSDALGMNTGAEKTDGGYILNGNKMFISNGPIADMFIVIARTGKSHAMNGYTAFIVSKDNPGLEIGKTIEKMGLTGCPMSELVFNDCFIPDSDILGRVGSGSTLMNSSLEWERCFEFASHIGAMRRMMDKSTEYAMNRVQFGSSISTNQSISNKIANMRVNIELAELLLYKIASMKDEKKNAFVEASILKLFVSESYVNACLDTVQIMGAYGYVKEYKVERELRDSIASTIYSGTSEIQRNIIYTVVEREFNRTR